MEHQQSYRLLIDNMYVRLEASGFNCIELQSKQAVSSNFLQFSQLMVHELGFQLFWIADWCDSYVTVMSLEPSVIMEIKIPSVGEAHQGFPKVTISAPYNKQEPYLVQKQNQWQCGGTTYRG